MVSRVLVLGGAVASMVSCGPVAEEGEWDIVGDFEAVEVRLGNGDLRVEGLDGDRVEIATDFGGLRLGRDRVARFLEGDTLIVDYGCALCGGDLAVGIPRELPIHVDLGNGDVGFEGIDGDVSATVRMGSIVATDLGGRFDGLAHAGGVELELERRPRHVRAVSRVGAVLVEVPAGSYFLDARSGVGSLELSAVDHDPESEDTIEVRARFGEARILGH